MIALGAEADGNDGKADVGAVGMRYQKGFEAGPASLRDLLNSIRLSVVRWPRTRETSFRLMETTTYKNQTGATHVLSAFGRTSNSYSGRVVLPLTAVPPVKRSTP